MAFLCPVRIKRSKKKKPLHDDSLSGPAPSMGRITGSASIETLVRVGIEKENGLGPEAKMVVLHDFTPCVDDELEVKRGQVVHVLYQENDWVYVISEEKREGFIPHSYCAQYGSQMATLALNVRKKLPRGGGGGGNGDFGGGGGGGGPGGGNGEFGGGGAQTQQIKATSMNGLPTTAAMAQLSGGSSNNAISTTPASAGGRGYQSDFEGSQQQQRFGNNRGPLALSSLLEPPGSASGPSGPGQQQPPMPVGSRTNSLMSETSSQPDVHPFYKEFSGRYVVLYSYQAQDENDLSVDRGQCVTVLNSDDPDWYWVSRYDQCEGFVPAGFIYPLDAIQRQQSLNNKHHQRPTAAQSHGFNPNAVNSNNGDGKSNSSFLPQVNNAQFTAIGGSGRQTTAAGVFHSPPLGSAGGSSGPSSYGGGSAALGVPPPSAAAGNGNVNGLPVAQPPLASSQQSPSFEPPPGGGFSPQHQQNGARYHGTELVMLYDYKAQAPDDLSVRRGDWVYADLSNQTVDGWLWSYAPKSRKYGFIPKAYARPPAMTSL